MSVSPNPTLKMTLIIMIVELVKKLMGEEDMAVLDYDEYYINSVDIHENLSEKSDYVSAHNLHYDSNFLRSLKDPLSAHSESERLQPT